MSVFTFKQFKVIQQESAMKVGTDSILLGCFVEVDEVRTVLDIGTGTGLLALMMAQRSSAKITAIEIEPKAAAEAMLNFSECKWVDRIFIKQCSIQQFAQQHQQQFDLILCNPPYYANNKNVAIAQRERSTARQTNTLTFQELAQSAFSLLEQQGKFWLILPVNEAMIFIDEAKKFGLFLQRSIYIKPKADKPANRLVLKFGLQPVASVSDSITIYDHNGLPSPAYKQIAKDFYTGWQFQN
jgi:tRNA1Val (adenine37-N6)-methyltransferase